MGRQSSAASESVAPPEGAADAEGETTPDTPPEEMSVPVVTAALVYVRTVGGGVVALQQGAPVPGDAQPEHVTLLLAQGVLAGPGS